MRDFPERREYPDYYDWQRDPVCPVCGRVCETIYFSEHYGGVLGCDNCITPRDAQDEEECFR